MCTMGDGTTNIGAFHESLNIAALWKLPVVFVIINNGLGMGTTVEQVVGRARPVQAGAPPTGCSRARVDGNDPMAVREAAVTAVEAARERQAVPARGRHRAAARPSVVDPAKYRSAARSSGSRTRTPSDLVGRAS